VRYDQKNKATIKLSESDSCFELSADSRANSRIFELFKTQKNKFLRQSSSASLLSTNDKYDKIAIKEFEGGCLLFDDLLSAARQDGQKIEQFRSKYMLKYNNAKQTL
jgi:hypothetical protein